MDVNKGGDANPNYRSRYVGREIKGGSKTALVAEFFAAMPPLSSSKALLSLAATMHVPDRSGRLKKQPQQCVSFIDVRRAHFIPKVKRKLAVRLPPELEMEHPDCVGVLKHTMYGTRDAAACWEQEIAEVLTSIGFEQGRSTPCNIWHQERGIRTSVHGDDFETLATFQECKWFADELKKVWSIVER